MKLQKHLILVLVGLTTLAILPSVRQANTFLTPSDEVMSEFQLGLGELIAQVDELANELPSLDQPSAQGKFLAIRKTYKEIEFLFTYLEPELTIQRINGAPLPKVDPMEENAPVVIDPAGLQVIDEALFLGAWDEETKGSLRSLLSSLLHELERMEWQHRNQHLSDRQVLEAMRDELIRAYTLGITGFDTPGSAHAMEDAQQVFASLDRHLSGYLDLLEEQNVELATELRQSSRGAVDYLRSNPDFDRFDRLEFLREYLDPLFGGLLDLQLTLGIETMYQVSPYPPALNYYARHLFSDSLMQPATYLNSEAARPNPVMVRLGQTLFFDPILSQDLSRSCASCHNPQLAFTDGQRKSLATGLEGDVGRNAPTLINSVYSDRYFHDLRTFELEMQIDHVVFSEGEFNTDYQEILNRLRQSEEYRNMFSEAFPHYARIGRSPMNVSTLKSALASYVASLTGFNSPFDRYARGESDELNEAARRGYNLFMGKAVCATCHFAPSFTGLVPPNYQDSESEILGVPSAPVWEDAEVDPDLGRRYNGVPLDAVDIFAFSFKTPTVRNIVLTAPYMHNGVYDSLEQVVRFYNLGGGSGIGIDLEHQTLPFDQLNLSTQEMSDLVAFMNVLTDTTGMTSVPDRLPTFENHEEWNQRSIGGEY